jgi:hypothetical protein
MPAVSVGDAQRRLYRKNDPPRRHDDLREHPICGYNNSSRFSATYWQRDDNARVF